MLSDKAKNAIVIVAAALMGLSLIVGFFVRLTGFGGYVSLHQAEIFKAREIKDCPTNELIRIINDYNQCKSDFGKRMKGPAKNSAIKVIATRDDAEAVTMLKSLVMSSRDYNRLETIYTAGKSRNRASVPILCDALKRHVSRHEDGLIVDALIKIDDPSALECFLQESPNLLHGRNKATSDADGDKADRAIQRWQDMKSGKIKQVTPFEVDRSDYTMSRRLLEVSSFGGYKFTVDSKWYCNSEKRLNDTTDCFEFDRYYGYLIGSVVRLKLSITKLSEDKAVALAERIKRQNSTFKNMPTINGNPYTASVSKSEGGHYFAYMVMKVGDLEVSAELSSENHHWFEYDISEILAIFKTFSRETNPNKKYSIFQ